MAACKEEKACLISSSLFLGPSAGLFLGADGLHPSKDPVHTINIARKTQRMAALHGDNDEENKTLPGAPNSTTSCRVGDRRVRLCYFMDWLGAPRAWFGCCCCVVPAIVAARCRGSRSFRCLGQLAARRRPPRG